MFKRFQSQQIVKSTREKNMDKTSKKHKCKLCENSFHKIEDLRNHESAIHYPITARLLFEALKPKKGLYNR